jgi:hypothetical protein
VPERDLQRYFGMAALADADTHDIESPADIGSLVKNALGDGEMKQARCYCRRSRDSFQIIYLK